MSIYQNINVTLKTDNVSKKYSPQETWTCTNGYIIINLWPPNVKFELKQQTQIMTGLLSMKEKPEKWVKFEVKQFKDWQLTTRTDM